MPFDSRANQEPRLRGAMIATCAFILGVCGLRVLVAYRTHAGLDLDIVLALLGALASLPALVSALFWREVVPAFQRPRRFRI